MTEKRFRVEVAYARLDEQLILELEAEPGITAQQAVERSGILERFPEIDLSFGFETEAVHRVDPDEPGSATSRFDHRMTFQREGWDIEVRSTAALSCGESAYKLFGRVEVRENGDVIFERQWEPTVPRRWS